MKFTTILAGAMLALGASASPANSKVTVTQIETTAVVSKTTITATETETKYVYSKTHVTSTVTETKYKKQRTTDYYTTLTVTSPYEECTPTTVTATVTDTTTASATVSVYGYGKQVKKARAVGDETLYARQFA